MIPSRLRRPAALLVAVTASLPLAGCGSGELDKARQDCVDTINSYRATLKLAAYTRWDMEESCADGQAGDDADSQTPHSAFGKCSEHAQNECPGWPGPPDMMIGACLAQMWAEGPGTDFSTHGHYINMSSPAYTMVACGFSVQGDGSVWAVQDFQ